MSSVNVNYMYVVPWFDVLTNLGNSPAGPGNFLADFFLEGVTSQLPELPLGVKLFVCLWFLWSGVRNIADDCDTGLAKDKLFLLLLLHVPGEFKWLLLLNGLKLLVLFVVANKCKLLSLLLLVFLLELKVLEALLSPSVLFAKLFTQLNTVFFDGGPSPWSGLLFFCAWRLDLELNVCKVLWWMFKLEDPICSWFLVTSLQGTILLLSFDKQEFVSEFSGFLARVDVDVFSTTLLAIVGALQFELDGGMPQAARRNS